MNNRQYLSLKPCEICGKTPTAVAVHCGTNMKTGEFERVKMNFCFRHNPFEKEYPNSRSVGFQGKDTKASEVRRSEALRLEVRITSLTGWSVCLTDRPDKIRNSLFHVSSGRQLRRY